MVFRSLLVALALLSGIYFVMTGDDALRDKVVAEKTGDVRLIPIASSDEILGLIAQGKRVVFVDAREAPEFEEEHIPGAINLTLREINQLTPEVIGEADIVIGYCLKDFRGYEVAKALHRIGVRNVHTMESPGLNGWKARRLPIYSAGKVTEENALSNLLDCAKNVKNCGGNKS